MNRIEDAAADRDPILYANIIQNAFSVEYIRCIHKMILAYAVARRMEGREFTSYRNRNHRMITIVAVVLVVV